MYSSWTICRCLAALLSPCGTSFKSKYSAILCGGFRIRATLFWSPSSRRPRIVDWKSIGDRSSWVMFQ